MTSDAMTSESNTRNLGQLFFSLLSVLCASAGGAMQGDEEQQLQAAAPAPPAPGPAQTFTPPPQAPTPPPAAGGEPPQAPPAVYKESPQNFPGSDAWKVAQPQDAMLRGKWWEIFNDPQLNALEDKVNVDNQNIKRAFEVQQRGEGFSYVELLTMCPSGWLMEPVEALDFIEEKFSKVHRLGEIKVNGQLVAAVPGG